MRYSDKRTTLVLVNWQMGVNVTSAYQENIAIFINCWNNDGNKLMDVIHTFYGYKNISFFYILICIYSLIYLYSSSTIILYQWKLHNLHWVYQSISNMHDAVMLHHIICPVYWKALLIAELCLCSYNIRKRFYIYVYKSLK